MDFKSIKFDKINSWIDELYETHEDWDLIRELGFTSIDKDLYLNEILFKDYYNAEAYEGNKYQLWRDLVEFHEKSEEKINVQKLGQYAFNDAVLPTYPYTSWQRYKARLINQNWDRDAIDAIEKDSYEILKHLNPDTSGTSPIKGLVMGNVQSGKTANMAGLMAMAADNGFNYVIVLTGTIENLRVQTANRLYNDLKADGKSTIQWEEVDNPAPNKSGHSGYNLSQFSLEEGSYKRYFSVSLKNAMRLRNLFKWIESDQNKCKQLKVLVIDDEADQASINTASTEAEEYSTINKLIRDFVHQCNVKAMNYIAYTATPYANVLNETSKNSLYPSDFIYLLEQSNDYIGPKEIFGTEEPEQTPRIPITRPIPTDDMGLIQDIHDNNLFEIPGSLKKAIQWFLVTVAVQRNNAYLNPVTMLVHTSFKIEHHENIANAIKSILFRFKRNVARTYAEMKELYEEEKARFNRKYFENSMENYSTKDNIMEYPKWEDIEIQLKYIMNLDDSVYCSHIQINEVQEPQYHEGIHIVIDNSRTTVKDEIVRLVYPRKKQSIAPIFIVIGGNTLSRGLTLEGLTTSYFLRNTNQADTLMQMGRWFGYRKGYEVLPRIWLDYDAMRRFEFLSQMNEELREEIKQYAANGQSPSQYAPRIKNSANYQLIRITSKNKMQSAQEVEFDYSGFNSQTIYFENNYEKLAHNYIKTEEFLNNLNKPKFIKRSALVWNDVSVSKVKDYLANYHVYEKHYHMSNIHLLIEWMEKNEASFDNWNVVFSGLELKQNNSGQFLIHGYSSKPSTRTRLIERSNNEVSNIGSLRNPNDLLIDIENITDEDFKVVKAAEVRAVRDKYGYGKVPQLLIYLIDKDSQPTTTQLKGKTRGAINLSHDAIGISVLIPGHSRSNMATFLSGRIDHVDADIDEIIDLEE